MALILAFRVNETATAGTSEPRRTSGPQPCESKTAELIFFPGVRYERHEPEAEGASKGRRSRRSKPRELIDLMD